MNDNKKPKMANVGKSIKTGEGLEVEVERIYKLLGAETQRRVLIKNYEIDVFAKFSKGPIEFSVIVECKEYKPTNRVSDQDMRNFALKLLAARECGKADKGVFITTSGYSKNALATAKQHNIQYLTMKNLYNQLVDFKEYVQKTVEEFTHSELGNWYIEQTGSRIEDYDSLPEQGSNQFLHKPLVKYADHIFFSENEKRLALLGNFGTGKTSFCLKYRDVLLRRYMRDPSQRIPVLISLSDFRSGIDIHQVIAHLLQKLPGVYIDLKLCLELQRMGRFFFLLDGLDEMATKVDRIVINENLREIDRLHSEGDNIYLLTCRTHFFQEKIADEFLRDYRVIYLTEWGRSELELYLKKRFKTRWHEYLNQITSAPSLEELSKTPMLLDMMVKSLSKIKEGDKIDLSKLYATYTSDWIAQQSKRRGAVMTPQQRHRFVETLAVKLYTENRTEIHFSELYEVARELSGYVDATRIDYFDTDARTATFITKDSKGNYGFHHKSFMEYFCASALADEINVEKSSSLAAGQLPKEILNFINRMDITNEGIEALQQWSRMFKKHNLSQNAVKILLRIGESLETKVEEHYGISKSTWDSLKRAIAFDDDKAMDEFIRANYEELRKMVIDQMELIGLVEYDVDDAVQELLIRLWTRKDKIRLEDMADMGVKSYLSYIIKHLLMDRYRLASRNQTIPLETLDLEGGQFKEFIADATIYNGLEYKETWRIIEQAMELAMLSDTAKRVFIARFREDKSIDEISNELKLNRNTARAMLYRVRKLVQRELADKGLLPSRR